MKNFLLVTIILVIVLFIKAINPDPNLTSSDPPSVLYYPSENEKPLDVAIVQDVSGSGAWNGIEKFNTSMQNLIRNILCLGGEILKKNREQHMVYM